MIQIGMFSSMILSSCEKEPIKMGFIGDLTSKNSQLSIDARNAVEYEMNQASVKEGVHFVIGHMHSNMAIILAKAIEAKDHYTGNHCERVRDFSMILGNGYNLSKAELRELKFGATLHD